jgi:hypothetical protein|tara:strand:+ start:2663 stop:2899 length:237 start_codon:yes stop_codon:yes gene_type:complete
MNSSLVNIESTGNGYEYTTYIFGVMFIISEILPLLKKKPNGLLHAILCLIQGSKCLVNKAEDMVKTAIEEKKDDEEIP